MARQPIHLQAAGKLTPRDRVWAAIRALSKLQPGGFTRLSMEQWVAKHAPPEATGRCIDERTINSYLLGLVAGGYLNEELHGGPRVHAIYSLERDVGVHAPRVDRHGREVTQGAATAQLWNGMRRLKRFDYRDLVAATATRVAVWTAKNYCGLLHKAGYLSLDIPSKPGMPARYNFVRDTGPRAPMIQRVKHVYDPNLGKVVWHPEADA